MNGIHWLNSHDPKFISYKFKVKYENGKYLIQIELKDNNNLLWIPDPDIEVYELPGTSIDSNEWAKSPVLKYSNYKFKVKTNPEGNPPYLRIMINNSYDVE
tara:strand:+ start:335 stop:637 length:303 start_codon:yes stop_codon:yes gene_type:complete